MKFKIESWTISKLISLVKNEAVNLNPPYQRNNIWTTPSQRQLVTSIKEGMPIPTFFLHKKKNNLLDIADGQQRTRAILAYYNGSIKDNHGNSFHNEKNFTDYLIPVVVIDPSVTQEAIRAFYVMINSTGVKLNNPELTKASEFNSQILKLAQTLASDRLFTSMGIFSTAQSGRMIDREYIEELTAQLVFGVGDKKNDIEKLYELDLNFDDVKGLSERFMKIIKLINDGFVKEIKKTRYSQRNDFYTLFGALSKHEKISIESFRIQSKLLCLIEDSINPSNRLMPELQKYAINCVTQSNSKAAREARSLFIEALLFNNKKAVNATQKKIMKYFPQVAFNQITTKEGFTLLNFEESAF